MITDCCFSLSSPILIETAQLRHEVGLLVDFAEFGTPLYLHKPIRIYTAHQASEVVRVLRMVEKEALAGHWVGGFLTYEAAAAFALPAHADRTIPLAWFAVFSQVDSVIFPSIPPLKMPTVQLEIGWQRYQRDIATILAHITAGDSYQVNYTLAAQLRAVDPAQLFIGLHTSHRHPYTAWLHCEHLDVASFSPELFLQRSGQQLWTAPIKGTAPSGPNPQMNEEEGRALERSDKDRAEHIMIVDMARNDLGKVCKIGSVRVDHLFERRLFPTVQHLESRVCGVPCAGVGLDGIMEALFPAASITGAPKQRTMEIISALENRPRGLYTGSIGVIRPGGDFIFNVAIRTVTWQGEEGRMGLGGGIVADSNSEREWWEIADKGRFLHEIPEPFQLIETFLLEQDGQLPHVEQHMLRLQRSANALGFACDLAMLESALFDQVSRWHQAGLGKRVVRLLLDREGQLTLNHRPCSEVRVGLKIRLADVCVDRLDRLLRHKTTRRQAFDQALQMAKEAGDDDALFMNNLGRITEGAIRAIMVRVGEQWYVPPVQDGLLASIWRAQEIKRLSAMEKSLTLTDLLQADEVRMGNSCQGGRKVMRVSDAAGKVLVQWCEGIG